MNKIICSLVLVVIMFGCNKRDSEVAIKPDESRFTKIILAEGLDEPMELAIAKDGRIIFVERKGDIKLYDPDKKQIKLLSRLSVFSGFEDGLLGVTLDPKFEQNGWLYLYYSPAGDKPIQRVSRMKLVMDTLILSTEKILLEIPVQRETCCHSAGSLTFGKDGNLYIAIGDNTSSKESDGYSPIDERPGRGPFDAQKSSANTQDLRGKILRIHPEKDGTYTIPDGNLFAGEPMKGRPEIYTMGCRNPYRISVNIKKGWLFWGDVGPDAGVDDKKGRGPQSYDEFNLAKGPGNFGWPYFVGNNFAYRDFNFSDSTVGEAYKPSSPVNNSPNNTGANLLPPAQPAWIWYSYSDSKQYPLLGNGGRSAMAGPVYHYKDYKRYSERFPSYYDGKIFLYEWMRNWIMAVTFDEQGKILNMEKFMPNTAFEHPIDLELGPKGDLYLLEYGSNWFSQNDNARLVHITYAEGNRAPVANIKIDKKSGATPLKVKFTSSGSVDYDGDSLLYAWSFGDSSIIDSKAKSPEHVFEKPGNYRVTLTVTDPKGEKCNTYVHVEAGNETPQLQWNIDGNKSFYSLRKTVAYKVLVADKEDRVIDHKKVSVHIDYLSQIKDLALVESGNQGLITATKYIEGKTLIEGSDCKSCHAIDKKSVGPSFIEVSNKYADGSKNNFLANKIITGGSGNWGHSSMSAHPQLTRIQTGKMVDYILSLGKSADLIANRPAEGEYKFDQHQGGEGIYIFTATYTDNGANGVSPKTGRARLIMRNQKIQAEDYDMHQNMEIWYPNAGKIGWVNHRKANAWFAFRQIDLTGISKLTFQLKEGGKTGSVEVRLGSIKGTKIAEIRAKDDTKTWEDYQVSIAITPMMTQQDLYFVYTAPEEGLIVDWILFE